jgi:diguanylate cyclase (GGDEF)-like protein
MKTKKLLAYLEKKYSAIFWIVIGYLFVLSVGFIDYITGNELAFSLFYLIPIVLVTWFLGKTQGIAISIIAAIIWFLADFLAGHPYSQPFIGYWNACIRFGVFLVVSMLLPALKELEREKEIARIDYLTGTANRRHFFELAQMELNRSQRYKHPFTIAYIDLDGFKAMNDQYGHQTGDKLLCTFVNQAKLHLRDTDIMARLGGDEFILLLPEIDQHAAQVAIPRIQSALLAEMQRNHWTVTFSIGVLTYQTGEISADELVKRADDLMYSVKKSGKNSVAYAVL